MATNEEIPDIRVIKAMVDARLLELKMSKVALAKKLGYSGYGGYYDLFSAKRTAMTHERLGDIAEALNWGRTRFTDPEGAIKREEFVRLEFQKYLETDVAKARDPETNKILGSMQWLGKYLPTVDLYQVVALAMEGKYKAEELQEAAELARRDHAAEEALHVELAKTEPACEKRRQAVAPDKPASKPALRRKK